MFEIKKRKWLFYLAVGVFGILFLFLLLYLFREPVGIFLSHVNNKSELAFVKEFLSELKKNEISKLGKYFSKPTNQAQSSGQSAQTLLIWLEENFDKDLRKRDYVIEHIVGFDEKHQNCFVNLSVKDKHKKLKWLTLVIIKKDGRYFVDHFYNRSNFPINN